MAEYLLTAHTPNGRKVTERVDAISADEAVQILRERGYTGIVLHTDDVGALYAGQRKVAAHITPAEYVSFRTSRGYLDRVVFLFRKMLKTSWALYAAVAALLIFRRVMGLPWSYLDYLPLSLLVVPFAWSLIAPLFNPVRHYDRLIEAVAWYRWEEVQRLLPTIRGHVSPSEVAFRQAQALAGLGELEEALAVVRPFANGRLMPEWLYWARMSSVYAAAGHTDRMLEVEERALELAPENATVLIDHASTLLRYQVDTRQAAALLEQAKSHVLSDTMAPFLDRAEGMLALELGDAKEALRRFNLSQAALAALNLSTPLIGGVIDRNHAYLALTHAKLGDKVAAQRHYQLAEPRLRAWRADDLIQRCEEALRQ